jgi:SAM-dependent methyltransferase
MYERYAQVFAASPGHRDYNARLADFLPGLLARMNIAPRTVLDVACGVGDLALGLAARGYQVTGVDLAHAMIEIARQRAAERGAAVTFDIADMRKLPYAGQFDLALCFGDSLNYMLTPADLRKALASIRRVLVPGGWVIFDLLTAQAVATYYADQGYILQNSDEVFEAHENDYEERSQIGTLTVTAFVRRPDGAYDRIRETHYQRGYPPEKVHRWTVEAGFTDPTWFTDWEIAEPMEDEDGEPTRVFCLAQAKTDD